jgi:hypothetical protein
MSLSNASNVTNELKIFSITETAREDVVNQVRNILAEMKAALQKSQNSGSASSIFGASSR